MADRDLQADAARGRKAEMEYQEVEAAFDAVEAALLKAWQETPIGADAKVLKLHMAMHNMDAVRTAIMRTIRAGKDAEAMLLAAREAIADQGLTQP